MSLLSSISTANRTPANTRPPTHAHQHTPINTCFPLVRTVIKFWLGGIGVCVILLPTLHTFDRLKLLGSERHSRPPLAAPSPHPLNTPPPPGNMCQALISNKQRVPSYLLTSTITCVEPTPLTASSRTLSALSTSIPPLNFEELIPPPTDVQEAAARVRDVHGQAGLKIIVKGYYRRGSARLIDQFEDEDCEPCVDLAAALSDFIVAYQICTLSSSYPATSEEEKQIGQLNKTITDAFKTCCARISVDGGLPMPPSKHEQVRGEPSG